MTGPNDRLDLEALLGTDDVEVRTRRIQASVRSRIRVAAAPDRPYVDSLVGLIGHPALVVAALAGLLTIRMLTGRDPTPQNVHSSLEEVIGVARPPALPSWLLDDGGGRR